MKLKNYIERGANRLIRSVDTALSSLSTLSNPSDWLKGAFSLGGADSGVPVNEKTINQITSWTSGVRLIAETVGSLPLKNIRISDGLHKFEKSNSWYLVARKPNSFMTANIFWEIVVKLCIHRGNAFAVIVRDNDYRATEIIPVHQDHTVDVIRHENKLYYRVSGVPQLIDQDHMLHFKTLGDGIMGVSLIEYLASSAGITLAAQKNGATFFKGGSQLTGVLEHPKTLTKQAADRLRESWHKTYHTEGTDNKVAVLEEGMLFKPISINPADAQVLDTLKKGNIDVSRILRLPPHMIMEMDSATYSNIEHQGLEFVQYTLTTWLSRFERELWDKLYTEKEKRQDDLKWRFNVDGLLRGDFKTRMEGYRTAINAGLKSQNECRALEDLDPFEGGNRRWIQMNMMPLDKVDELLGHSISELLKNANQKENGAD